MDIFDRCYNAPLSVANTEACLLYLVMAIGLVVATPEPSSHAHTIIERIRGEPIHRAELFYRCARRLRNTVDGFEDADLWSVQALSLMAMYMLSISKRNGAYSYIG